MVISDTVQMWLITIVAIIFSVGAIIFWLWEHVLSMFYGVQKETCKEYNWKQWLLTWIAGLVIVAIVIFAWVKLGVNLF